MACEKLLKLILLAAQPAEPVLERLDPPRRAAVIMALIGIAITGILLVACVMLGANWVRRMARQTPRNCRHGNGSQPASKNRKLRDSLGDVLPKADSGDTIQMNQQSGETMTDR